MCSAFNKSFLEIFRYSEADVDSKRFYNFIVPEDVPCVEKNFRAMIKGKEIEKNCVVRAIDGSGAIIPIEANCGQYKMGEDIKGVTILVRKTDEE